MNHHDDLFVFLAVLAAGIVLIALGVSPGSLSTVAIALSGLYGAYRHQRAGTGTGADKDERNGGS
jgi:EamA domain-containing membrane protein RarD